MTKSYRIKPQFAYMLNALAVHNHRTLTGQLERALEDAYIASGLHLHAPKHFPALHVDVGIVRPNVDGINTVYPTNAPSPRDVHPQHLKTPVASDPDAIDFDDEPDEDVE